MCHSRQFSEVTVFGRHVPYLRSETVPAVLMGIQFFCDVAPCLLLNIYTYIYFYIYIYMCVCVCVKYEF
jgi:hypothetical protein